MIRMTRIAILAMAIVVGQSNVQGQTHSDSSTSHMLVAGVERAKAAFLVGSFATTITFAPNPAMPKGVTGTGTSVIAYTLDSLFLSIEDQSVNDLFGHYKAHGMLGFDAQQRQFVLSMFNNFGDHPTYHGNFVGDTLVLQTKVEAPRGSFDQQLRWYKEGETVRLRVLNDFGKGFLPVLDQTATPASPKTK